MVDEIVQVGESYPDENIVTKHIFLLKGNFLNVGFFLAQTYGTVTCSKPLDFEVRRVRDNVQVDDQNFQNFREFNKEKGFTCVNDEQPRGTVCEDYKIRFLCPRKSNQISIQFSSFYNFSFSFDISFYLVRHTRYKLFTWKMTIFKIACW